MTIVQPPTSYDGKTAGGGGLSIFDASGNVQAEKSRSIKYGEPIILFNPNNKAGLQLQNAISEAKEILPKALTNAPEIKVDVSKLDEAHAIPVQKDDRVGIGTSAVLQVNQDASISIINTPKISESDREILNSFLETLVKALIRRNQIYRANIMLLDPNDNLLKIAAHYNMDGFIDKNIALPPDKGCAGTALQKDSEALYDPRVQGTLDVNPDKVWRELRCIISMPIHDSRNARLGVLNIDSNRPIQNSEFLEEDFKNAMRIATDAFG